MTAMAAHTSAAASASVAISTAQLQAQEQIPVPVDGGSANALLAAARRALLEAAIAPDPSRRFVAADLAALRAATAVLAARARARQGGRGPRGVWQLLSAVAPELSEWSDFFTITAGMRAAVEAGAAGVGEREADDLMRDAELFCARVASMLTREAG